VSWNSVSGASEYYIYRSTSSSGSYESIGSASSTSYTDNTVSSGTTYYYKVSAYNNCGEGSQSSYAFATTIPGVPSNVSAAESTTSSGITVSWDTVDGATGYYVYRSTSSSTSSFSKVGTITSSSSTSYTDNTVESGTAYYYKVSAYNSVGEAMSEVTGPVTIQIDPEEP
jgi:fibronectin type 3 domain-containing protein